MKSYEFDIAISLCKQDISFAQRLISFLNPGLKIFFYESNQEELISKSGPQAFAEIFKEKSRVVVVLSRDEWSESYYTDIERNAIIDRTSVKNEGYHFLFVIPMEHGQIPPWYPSTRIYADPTRFSVDQLARFIEFKVTELGGVVKPVTLEDRHAQFLEKIEEKKILVQLQGSKEAVDAGWLEMQRIRKLFDEKIESLKRIDWSGIWYDPFFTLKTNASFRISNYELNCRVPDFVPRQIPAKTTQEYFVEFKLYEISDGELLLLKEWSGFFLFGVKQYGWATPIVYNVSPTDYEWQLLFEHRGKVKYDLQGSQSSNDLVDHWFQELFKLASVNLSKFLK